MSLPPTQKQKILQHFQSTQQSAAQSGMSSNQTATSTMMTCPFTGLALPVQYKAPSKYLPCDVSALTVENTTDKQSVSCTASAKSDLTLTDDQRALLGSDDLLLQVVADYDHDGTYDAAKMKKGKILLSGASQPACPTNEHLHLAWAMELPSAFGAKAKTMETWVQSTPAPIEVLARSTRTGSGTGGFLAPFWSSSASRRVTYFARAESCGVRSDGRVPTEKLTCRVEVWPNDSWELSFQLPALQKTKISRESSRNLWSGDQTRSSSRTQTSGYKTDSALSRSSTVNAKKGTDYWTIDQSGTGSDGITTNTKVKFGVENGKGVSSETLTYSATQGMTQTSLTETDGGGDVTFKAKSEVVDGLSLKRNGVEVDISKTINTVLKIYKDTKAALDAFKDAMPKAGFFLDYSLSFMEGTITGKWGVVARPKPTHARIWTAHSYWEVEIAIKVVDVKGSLAFGISFVIKNYFASNPLLELEAKIEGAFATYLAISETFSSDTAKNVSFGLDAKGTGSLGAYAKANLAGYTNEASIEAKVILQFTGAFKVGLDQDPVVEGELKWLPMRVLATVTSSFKTWNGEVFRYPDKDDRDAKTIWEGKLPGDG